MAQVESLNAQQALSLARPFKKQQLDKGAVWVLFAGSSTLLFLGTVLLENNSGWFPAIARANQAMQEMKKEQQTSEQQEAALKAERAAIDTEVAEVQRQSRLVEQELTQARVRVLSEIPQTLTADDATPATLTPRPAASITTPAADSASTPAIITPGPSGGGGAAAQSSEASSAGGESGSGVVSNGSAGVVSKGGVRVDASEVARELAGSYVLEAKQALAALKQQAAAAGVKGVAEGAPQTGGKQSEESKV